MSLRRREYVLRALSFYAIENEWQGSDNNNPDYKLMIAFSIFWMHKENQFSVMNG